MAIIYANVFLNIQKSQNLKHFMLYCYLFYFLFIFIHLFIHSFIHSFIIHSYIHSFIHLFIKVTVQFETEGNGQNEIVSHMDRSEVKLYISEKNIVISHIQNEILKQKNFTGSRFEGTPKLLKAFFSRQFSCQNYETLEVPTRAIFRPLV